MPSARPSDAAAGDTSASRKIFPPHAAPIRERETHVHPERVHRFCRREPGAGPVLYWMSRDQRADDNWALLFAQQEAMRRRRPLAVVFCLAGAFPRASRRHYTFMLAGLRAAADRLADRRIPFFLLHGDPPGVLPAFARRCGAGLVVADFDPLRIKQRWKAEVAARLDAPLWEVDAHNVVPCRAASGKAEYGAYTLRPRLRRRLHVFLTCFPPLRRHPVDGFPLKAPGPDWDRARRMAARIPAHGTAGGGPGPGPDAAARRLRLFLRAGLDAYPDTRNDPVADGQSGLSAYLHFGQLAPQRAALEVWNAGGASPAARDALLEELIVRRELSDNFCLYTPAYDSTDAFPAWARTTLEAHASDPRPALYPADRLEAARTDDALWNAAQRQLLVAGKMHGYLRMYWGKKILEWSRDPAEALERVLTLNDRYSYDGRDPNGYAGGAWCVGGVHDRAWPERPVFGKVRYMNAAGCRRKFDVDAYLRKIDQLTS